MQRFKIGPDLDAIRARAEQAIDESFQRRRVAQGFYAHKVMEARRLMNGETSDLIEREAKLRGVTPGDLAETILLQSKSDEDAELERVRLKQSVRSAKTVDKVREITQALGLEV